jgi:hypothetical protein
VTLLEYSTQARTGETSFSNSLGMFTKIDYIVGSKAHLNKTTGTILYVLRPQ